MIRTHLAIIIFFILLLINSVENKLVFISVALIATFLPDIDSKFSKLGQRRIFRPLQFFVRHRGILHSFIFLFLITLFFVLFLPVVAFPLFLGYSIHLLADSFSKEGIKPFYPFKKNSSGSLKTGGKIETSIFVVFILGNLFLLVFMVFNVF
jgi:inner membrane protein